VDIVDAVSKQQKRKALAQASRAQDLHRAGALPAAIRTYEKASEMAPLDLEVVTVVADGLAELGQRSRAIEILQVVLQKNAVNETVLMVIGKIAQNLDVPEIAAKIYSAAIDLNPGEASNYVNLVECYRLQQQFDDAVGLTKSALEMFPQYAPLWNILGTLMQNQRQADVARTFYDEALRLDPKNSKYQLNIANLKCDQNENPEQNYLNAIEADPDNHVAHIGLATYRLQHGDLAGAWDHYEYRKYLDRGYSKSVRFNYEMPEWQGESLDGKSILVLAEQGVGDEIFFAANFERLLQESEQLFIGCDPRLVSVFRRSFPGAKVAGFEDQKVEGLRHRSFPDFVRQASKIDYCVWAGSLPLIWWRNIDSIPVQQKGYLTPDTARKKAISEAIDGSSGRLKIGLSWRSGNLSFERSGYYMGLEGARQFLCNTDADFYCLQYGWDQSEIDWLREKCGVTLHTLPNVDLKDDLEANLAIMANMDLVIGPPIATQQMAMALGVPTWIVTGGAPWWQFGQDGWGPTFSPNVVLSSGVYKLGQERACRIYALVFEAYLKRFDCIEPAILGPAVQRAIADYVKVREDTAVREFTVEYAPVFEPQSATGLD
jgi:tetratricopeptide (TPR) repeat protein